MTWGNGVLMRGARGSEHSRGSRFVPLFFFTLAGHRDICCVSFPGEM